MASDIKLFNMDCMEALREMEDNQFDLAIVDPPYGIGMDGTIGSNKCGKVTVHKKKNWDKSAPSYEYFSELIRVSENQIIWGANYYPQHLRSSMGWIFWNKEASADFSDGELAYSSFDRALRMFTFAWMGMRQGDMKNKEHRIHPTQKPVALYKWLLTNYAEKGQTILDTHLGSGSIALACWDLGFDLCGYELDSDYYKAAFQRLEEHKKQGQFEFK
jgi:site-specific DNA-methyltransferase (adenine-specific)